MIHLSDVQFLSPCAIFKAKYLSLKCVNLGHTCILPLSRSDTLPAAVIEKVLLGHQRMGDCKIVVLSDVHSAQCLCSPEERKSLKPGDETAPASHHCLILKKWLNSILQNTWPTQTLKLPEKSRGHIKSIKMVILQSRKEGRWRTASLMETRQANETHYYTLDWVSVKAQALKSDTHLKSVHLQGNYDAHLCECEWMCERFVCMCV